MTNEFISKWIEDRVAILATSSDRGELETAATALAAADNPAALDSLAPFLTDPAFLARLDDLDDAPRRTQHLAPILDALVACPSPETAALCLQLNGTPFFGADIDRKIFILRALSVVTPMTPEAADAFREANEDGYFASSACLLASNSSPAAMALLLEMMAGDEASVEKRVDVLHAALIPNRNRIPVIEFVGRLSARNPGQEVISAAVESIYDFQTKWRRGHPLPPPPWRTASVETLKYLVHMTAFLATRFTPSAELREAIDSTTALAKELIARRGG